MKSELKCAILHVNQAGGDRPFVRTYESNGSAITLSREVRDGMFSEILSGCHYVSPA